MTDRHAEGTKHPADIARARLAALRRDAAAVYAAISEADEVLRGLAERRVAAERDLRVCGTRHLVAAEVAAAHALDRPGLRTQLATGLRARREWRVRQSAAEAVAAATAGPLGAARQALTQVKDEFAAQLGARAGLVARLRGLTAECAAAREQIPAEPGATATESDPMVPQ